MIQRNQLCKLKSNGAKFAIAEVTDTHVTIQGWVHRETLTLRDFAIRFEMLSEPLEGSSLAGCIEE